MARYFLNKSPMKRQDNTIEEEPISRSDYQEMLLARMAGGDLYANEMRLKIRRVDMMLDRLRIALGDKPIYTKEKK